MPFPNRVIPTEFSGTLKLGINFASMLKVLFVLYRVVFSDVECVPG